MKVSNNISITSSLIARNDTVSQKETIQEDVKYMKEQPVRLSISKEGQAYYRSSIQPNSQESAESILDRREQLKNGKVCSIDYSYEISKKAAQLNKDRAEGKGSALSITEKADSYVKAYAELYDEIVQGYENGTRELYTADENGIHKLTKEEELSALNEAYESSVDNFVTMEKTNQHARETIQKNMEQIAKITSKETLATNYLEQHKEEEENISDNLNDKMYQATASFREKYKMFNPLTDTLSQLLTSVKIL